MTSQSPSDQAFRASNDVMEATTFLTGANAAFIEGLYAQWQANPDAVDPSWRKWFAELGQQGLTPAQLGRGPEGRRDAKLDLRDSGLRGALTGLVPPPQGGASAADPRPPPQES